MPIMEIARVARDLTTFFKMALIPAKISRGLTTF